MSNVEIFEVYQITWNDDQFGDFSWVEEPISTLYRATEDQIKRKVEQDNKTVRARAIETMEQTIEIHQINRQRASNKIDIYNTLTDEQKSLTRLVPELLCNDLKLIKDKIDILTQVIKALSDQDVYERSNQMIKHKVNNAIYSHWTYRRADIIDLEE